MPMICNNHQSIKWLIEARQDLEHYLEVLPQADDQSLIEDVLQRIAASK